MLKTLFRNALLTKVKSFCLHIGCLWKKYQYHFMKNRICNWIIQIKTMVVCIIKNVWRTIYHCQQRWIWNGLYHCAFLWFLWPQSKPHLVGGPQSVLSPKLFRMKPLKFTEMETRHAHSPTRRYVEALSHCILNEKANGEIFNIATKPEEEIIFWIWENWSGN